MTLVQSTGRMYIEIGNPTVNDDSSAGYENGNFWQNSLTSQIFQCKGTSVGAAVWQRFAFEFDDVEFGTVKSTGGVIRNVTTPLSYPYNIQLEDYIILVDTSSLANTVVMPLPALGQIFIIKDKSGNALVRNITIDGNGSNIDGAQSIIIDVNFLSKTLVNDSIKWYSI